MPVPAAVVAADVAPREMPAHAPAIFHPLYEGRTRRALGDVFGLANFGVNFTTLAPGARSALLHAHSAQDEFIYILEGSPTLLTGEAEHELTAGMCAGFKAGTSAAHQLVNRSNAPVRYLEVGDRSQGDTVVYPNDDLLGRFDTDGAWRFTRKDGSAL